ncbi:MFS family permease [Bacillus thermophilus]|uniref:MFS family permease n=1 Tax=Siminovitchia thermophila TaxID=1245522 RepID=A0ABS2R956_9BACI|nr:MFS transporter [Siminovitchia thermophila]MBM7716181.1 MFS family permease [Siminovitchia thermophila]ONK21471.1 MFS transporter [Bacillus sp. VT-16-64]
MKKKYRIWTKPFISLFCSNLSVFVIFYGLVSTLPLYAVGALNKTDQEAGLLMSIFLLSAIIVRPFTGKMLDTAGKRKMLWMSLGFYLLCTIAYYFIKPFQWLLVLRFIHGIWFSVVTTACGAIAADLVPPARRGTGLGYFTMSTNLGVVLGPLIALFLIQTYSFDALFIILSLLMIIGALLSLSIPDKSQFKPMKTKKKFSFNDIFESKAIPVAFLACLIGLSYASILSYLSIYAQSKNLLGLTSTFFLVFAVVMLLARPFTGRLFDIKGPNYILFPGLILFMMGFVVLAKMHSGTMFLLAGAFVGLGYGALIPSLQTLAIQSTNIKRSGYATATFYTFYDVGIAAGSYIFGIIAASYSYEAIYLLSGALVCVVLLLTLYLKPRKQTEKVMNEAESV